MTSDPTQPQTPDDPQGTTVLIEPGPAVQAAERARRRYQAAFGTAAVAGIFCLLVAVSMGVRHYQERQWHPLDSARAVWLDKARAALKDNQSLSEQKRTELRETVRQQDKAIITGYRRSQAFYDRGAYLLVIGVAVFLAAAGLASSYRNALPTPGAGGEKYDLRLRLWGRWSVAGLIVLLLGGAGALSLSSRPLSFELAAAPEAAPPVVVPTAPVPAVTQPAPPATEPASKPAPPAPVPVAPPVAPIRTDGWPRTAQFPTPTEITRQWPRFRGPGGLGHAGSTRVPLTFDGKTGRNIAWKTPIPVRGLSSPVVWGDRVFVTGGTAKKREVYGYDARTGNLLWTHTVAEMPKNAKLPEGVMEDTGFAACTPVADAERVYAIFATGEIVALEHDGTKAWGRFLGPLRTDYGHAASLAMHVVHKTKARILVQLDQGIEEDKISRLVALDAGTGHVDGTVKPRPVGSSWTSPIVIHTPSGPQLITLSNPWVIAYDPGNGKELWRADCLEGDGAPSATYAGGLVIAGNTSSWMNAIRPDGRGNVTKTHIVWQYENDIPDICTPVADDQYVYMLLSDGLLTCLDLKTGKKVYTKDLVMPCTASPVIVGDKLILLGKKGVLLVAKCGPKFQEISRSILPREETQATPALVDGMMILRGKKHLYGIREGAQLPATRPATKPATGPDGPKRPASG